MLHFKMNAKLNHVNFAEMSNSKAKPAKIDIEMEQPIDVNQR
jgi:hypothetical protein